MVYSSAFKTPDDETAYLAAYEASMKAWPVPYEEMQIPSRFGRTHVVASGPKGAPPLVLVHGYMATLVMWVPNVAAFSQHYRVYAVDVMGQPGKSIPNAPIRDAGDYVVWLTAVLHGLCLDRISLVGMSFGGWLALQYAVAAPERVQKLALLSPAASFLPIAKQFGLRGALMLFLARPFWVHSFMRWLGFNAGDVDGQRVIDLIYLGLKHFRSARETLRVAPTVFSDDTLRALRVPVLLLIGEHEVIYDPRKALARARHLIPRFEGELVPRCSHDMSSSQHRIVNPRVLDFLNDRRR
jgi:pimeloyl-ACP methyl ester carboxylesterase